MMSREKAATAVSWLLAVSIGSVTTSGFYYLVYGEWKPLVIGATIVSFLHVIKAASTFLNNV